MKNNKNSRSVGQFTGLGTALITPLEKNGEVSWTALSVLVGEQIAGGVNFLVPCGTTGSSPTLTHEEHDRVIGLVVKKAGRKIPVMAGTGSNSTAEAERLTMAAKQAGADAALVVMPYYNKPTPKGIKAHYRVLAKIGLPIFLYDIPGRCGGNMCPAEIILELAHEGTIAGLKWASGNLDQLQAVQAGRPESFTLLSGDDKLTYEAMRLGADGVISVLGNLLPGVMAKFVTAMSKGNHKFGLKEHSRLLRLMEVMFIETNPIPIQTAMAMVLDDVFQEVFRLPLIDMEENNRAKLQEVLRSYGLLAIAEQSTGEPNQ